MRDEIIKAIGVTAELTGTELSALALRVMERDLSVYPEGAVLMALERCRKELTGRLTLAAIIERIDDADGRPDASEAWATAIRAADEAATVVWTEETAQAFFQAAKPILDEGDKVAARMAFVAAYDRLVAEARRNGRPLHVTVSLGQDERGRAPAIEAAVSAGLLARDTAQKYLPEGLGTITPRLSLGGAVGADGGDSMKKLAEIGAFLISAQT